MKNDEARGRRIREARESKYSSQTALSAEMSRRLGRAISRGAVGNWELGGGIDSDHLSLVAELTGYAFEYLRTGKGPKHDAPSSPDASAGDRIRRIQDRMRLDLARDVGVKSPELWDAILDSLALVHPHIAEEVCNRTGLPMSYVQDGVIDDLSRDQLAVLFAGAAPRRDPPTPGAAAPHKQAPGAPRGRLSASQRRSS